MATNSIVTYRKVASPTKQISKFAVAYKNTHGYVIDNTNIYFKCDDMCIRVFNRSICTGNESSDQCNATGVTLPLSVSGTTGELRFTLEGHAAKITCLSIKGNILLSIDTDVIAKRWNTETGECISTITLEWEKTDYANRPVHRRQAYIQVACEYNNEIIGACSDGIIRVWSSDGIPTRFSYKSNIVALIVHKDRVIASCRNENAYIHIWDFTTKQFIMEKSHYGCADGTSFMSLTASDDTIFAGDYHGNVVSWCAKTFTPKGVIEPQKPSYRNIHKLPILALHCQNDVITAGKYVNFSDEQAFLSWHIIDSKKQAFTALLCMQRLGYPPEIIHEIMSHFNIVPHSTVNTYSADGTFA